jgi:DNA-binding MarR family transcriptional regulator
MNLDKALEGMFDAEDRLRSSQGVNSPVYMSLEMMRLSSYTGPICNQDIAERLGWEINRVTPRVMELREMNLVVEAYRDVNPKTNRKCIYWKVR